LGDSDGDEGGIEIKERNDSRINSTTDEQMLLTQRNQSAATNRLLMHNSR